MEAAAARAPEVGSGWPRAFLLLDVLPVVAIVCLGAFLDTGAPDTEQAGIGSALLAAAVAVPLLWRRSYPLVVFCVVVVAVMGAANTIPYPSITGGVLAAYSVAAYGERQWLSLSAVIVVAVIVIVVFPGPLPRLPAFPGGFLLLVTPWLAGNATHLRQRRIDSVTRRNLELEHERSEAERVLGAERARIARELHDVVAHSVGVMVVQAGAARQVLRSKPDRATEALVAVEESGREALDELRHLLGLLTDTSESPLAPQPGLDALPALVERVKGAGLSVSLRIEGDQRRLPPGADLAAYRVVQEALTNALRHSGGASTDVVVAYGPDHLRLTIVDDGRSVPSVPTWPKQQGAGRGLMGMRERVALYGGTFDAGPRAVGGYAVTVRLPMAVARE